MSRNLKKLETATTANIAVATVSGKAYYLIVNELKRRAIPFISLKPDEPIPIEVKVVITAEKDRFSIKHEKVLVLQDQTDPEILINEALQISHGKQRYERITIGIDPGEVLGLAVLADGEVFETCNCFSIEQTLDKIQEVLKSFKSVRTTMVSVKVGDGVPEYKEKLLLSLDESLSPNVVLESVSEAGTNRQLDNAKHRRGLRDIISAIRIAGRNGHEFPRRNKKNEPDS